ncbi:hypothetical protein [Streptomyces sp. STCH 565 A]|uniref:hypothetical protein n=1 Tax=Streptomyces sp. STCH 565 A TaxID=2950532 RepID=UPI002075C9E4|nr:hypothetical protein [Streptomyces sp. STCH 565 A]MCM8548911.1 hypothetical protein [Streptomyces sp. STCH 565 A]
MTRLHTTADRLATGSGLLARRLATRTAAWVRRGRRDDLTGVKAALGCWLRLGLLVVGGWLLWRLVRAVPNLMWVLTAGWIVASWRAGKPAPAETPGKADEEPPTEAPEIPHRHLLIHWLDRLTRDRAGIHLTELHQTLTKDPAAAALTRAQMRAWLDRHHITVDRTLRVGSVAGRSGVSRATVEALLRTIPPLPETSPLSAALRAPDLHDSPPESGVERGGEQRVDPHFDTVALLFQK